MIHMGSARTVVDCIQESSRAGCNGDLVRNIIVDHGNKIAQREIEVKELV